MCTHAYYTKHTFVQNILLQSNERGLDTSSIEPMLELKPMPTESHQITVWRRATWIIEACNHAIWLKYSLLNTAECTVNMRVLSIMNNSLGRISICAAVCTTWKLTFVFFLQHNDTNFPWIVNCSTNVRTNNIKRYQYTMSLYRALILSAGNYH